MSSTEEKKETASKSKVRLTAAWEWFKSAAWLQVLLIVAVVVGVVVAIPYIVQGISDLVSSTNSHFYESREITYDDFLNMIEGNDPNRADGYVGDGTLTSSTVTDYSSFVSEDREGFVLMFYKCNCDNCDSMQYYLEQWYNDTNSKTGIDQNLRLYTIDVSYVPDDSSESESAEGTNYLYENESISLAEQTEMLGYMENTYLSQDSDHQNSEVTAETFNQNLDVVSGGGTIPTPTFVLYTKDKSETSYDIANPTKVICGAIGDLDISTYSGVYQQMFDVFNFSIYHSPLN